ncbi:MAG: GNAT family N-acetyltransferase [Candidatus Thorarchaeota archaeon]|jgi:GNAT superfamily N-acetyltransferase
MPSDRIQTFEPGDEEEIVGLFEASFGEADYYFPRTVSSWIWRYIQRPGFDPESILMIRKEDELVAALSMTHGTIMVNGNPKKVALIDDVSTHPQWRRQGLATTLMRHAIDRAREMNCWGVHLSADPDSSAIRIYKRVGFEIITHCINMLSVLQHRRAARFGKRRQAIPLLALSLLDSFRNMRIDKNLCQIEITDGRTVGDVALRAQKENELPNGTLQLDDEYVKWMANPRADGALKMTSITKDHEFSGMLTVSSSDFSGPGATDRMAVIGNLILSEAMQTKDVIATVLHRAKGIAKDTLDCPMTNMFVDSRAETLKSACKKAGFMEVGQSASMFHSLGQPQRMVELEKGIWSQPVETAASNP